MIPNVDGGLYTVVREGRRFGICWKSLFPEGERGGRGEALQQYPCVSNKQRNARGNCSLKGLLWHPCWLPGKGSSQGDAGVLSAGLQLSFWAGKGKFKSLFAGSCRVWY